MDSDPKHHHCNSAESIDETRRRFLFAASCVIGGVGAVAALTPFIASWMPDRHTLAKGASVQVDLTHLQPGEQITIEWRGKPVWVIRRTKAMLAALLQSNPLLRDPESRVAQQPAIARNAWRSVHPEYLVLIGICTHLGCVPNYKPTRHELTSNGQGGFFCPCHGSTFDLAGRVFKGMPAPINLEVPPHHFIDQYTLVVGA